MLECYVYNHWTGCLKSHSVFTFLLTMSVQQMSWNRRINPKIFWMNASFVTTAHKMNRQRRLTNWKTEYSGSILQKVFTQHLPPVNYRKSSFSYENRKQAVNNLFTTWWPTNSLFGFIFCAHHSWFALAFPSLFHLVVHLVRFVRRYK